MRRSTTMLLSDRVILILRTARILGEPITLTQIEEALRITPNRPVLKSTLHNLERQGVVRRSTAGHYWEYIGRMS